MLLVSLILSVARLAGAQRNSWIATWTASPQAARPDPDEPLLKLENQTVRERMRVSLGGNRICIRLTNEYGSVPLFIGSMTVAMPNESASVRPDSIRTITFRGSKSVSIPAGAPMLSDPVAFPVSAEAEISVSLYLPKRIASPTMHSLALERAVVSLGDLYPC